MDLWIGDLPGCSLEEVMHSMTENRAWSKELRLKTLAVVNSRLAKQIGAGQYSASRSLINEGMAECKRRGIVLMKEIRTREDRRSFGVPHTF